MSEAMREELSVTITDYVATVEIQIGRAHV